MSTSSGSSADRSFQSLLRVVGGHDDRDMFAVNHGRCCLTSLPDASHRSGRCDSVFGITFVSPNAKKRFNHRGHEERA